MAIVSTLKRESIKEVKKERTNKIKINFDDDCKLILEKLLKNNNPEYGLVMQALTAKEIQSIIQQNFSIFQFEVSDIESITSERISGKFAPSRYVKEPKNSDTKTFLDDIYNCDDIVIKDEDKKSWSRSKVKIGIKEGSKYYTNKKEYLVGNTPKGIKISIKKDGKTLLDRPIFTIPGVSIDDCSKNMLYKNIAIGGKYRSLERYESADYIEDNMYKILDLNYVLATCLLLENCYKYVDTDPGFLYNSENSYYNLEYTVDDFKRLMDVSFLTKKTAELDSKIESLICECAIAVTHMQTSELLAEVYEKNLEREYSKSFETKKNIPEKIKAVMRNNRFLESFKLVELDESVDIEKFYLVENEFSIIKELLELNRFIKGDGEIRFRRLGQHKSAGLYYPHTNCICIDINNPNSFIHELGHLIDNKLLGNRLASNDSSFRLIAINFKRALEQKLTSISDEKIANSYKRKRGYYHTPTEIFAKAFEMYMVLTKKMVSSLLPNKELLVFENGYPDADESLMNKINEYFSKIFEVEENINTTTSGAEQTIITLTEAAATVEENIDVEEENIVEENNDRIAIEPVHDGDGANFIFRIIQEALIDENGVNYRPQRRRRLNRRPLTEDTSASQMTFF